MMTVEKRTITRVRDASSEQKSHYPEPLWFIDHDIEGGSSWMYIFPHSRLQWRVAEYNLDPNDIDKLIEVAIYEFHMTDNVHSNPTHLWNTDEATARQAHLGRVEAAKSRVVHLDPNNQLDVIRRAWNPHHPALAIQRKHVRDLRSQMGR